MREKKVEFAKELYDKIWKTKGSRFNAYHRLRITKSLSYYTTSLLSAYLIITNLLIPFELVGSDYSKTISFISVSLSIVLLVFVIMENSMEYGIRAENFHNCSKSLGKLFNRLDSLMDDDKLEEQLLERINKEYGEIIDKHDNHSPIDYALHKAKHPNEFALNWWERNWIRTKYDYLIHSKYFLFMFGPPLIALALTF